MAKYPPDKFNEVIRLLDKLGFVKAQRIGNGGHSYKYYHPSRKMICENDRPFIIVPEKMYKQLSQHICKKLICYGFSEDEVREVCKNC